MKYFMISICFLLFLGMANAQAVYLSDTRPLIGYGWTLTKEEVSRLMQQPHQSPRHPCIISVTGKDDPYLVFKIRKQDPRYADGICIIYLEGRKEPIAKVHFHQTHDWSGFYIIPLPDDAVLAESCEPHRLKFKFKKIKWIY